MTYTLFVHLVSERPFVGDAEELPQAGDQVLICNNPRRRGGKDVDSFLPEVVTVMIPWHRISFVEVIPSETREDVVTFVRE
jgi:hypothetical protein